MIKHKFIIIFGTIVLIMMMFGCPNEQSINQVSVAEISNSKTAYLTIGVNEGSRTALPYIDVESFERFVLTGRTTGNTAGVSVDLTWDGDGTTKAYTKLTTANIAVTAGASYSFTLTAFKSGASWSDTKELTVAIGTANNHISFSLSFAAPSANSNGTGTIAVTLTVPNKVATVDAVLKKSDGTPMSTSAGLRFDSSKATYDASGIPSGNYVLTFILWGDTDKKLKLGEWREYVCVVKGLTSISLPSIDNSADLDSIYTITLDLNGGTLTGTFAGSYTRHSDVSLPTASRTGYTFNGWWKVTGEDTTADATTDIWNKDKDQTGNVTFKAGWTPKWDIDNTGDFVYGDRVFQKTGMKKVMESNAEIYGSGSDGVFVTGRKVTLSPYSIGKFEVTQELYEAVMGKSQSEIIAGITGAADYGISNYNPIYYVSWYDAVVFCNKLTSKILGDNARCYKLKSNGEYIFPEDYNDGIPILNNSDWNDMTCDWNAGGYRLPTECEWEFAARGGNPSDTTTWGYAYSGSGTIDAVAWYLSNSNSHTWEVGSNDLGIFDMSGNVYEWCWDCYSSSITAETLVAGPQSGDYRVFRGGSWGSNAEYCTVSYRLSNNFSPYSRNSYGGFRIARTEGTWASSSEQVSNYVATGSGNFVVNGVECLKTGMTTVNGGTINGSGTAGVFVTGRNVTLSPYSIGKFEVTQELYEAVMGYNPSSFTVANATLDRSNGETTDDLRPVENINWYQAITFCNKLSLLMGKARCYNVGSMNDDDWRNITYDQIPHLGNGGASGNTSAWDAASCDFTQNGYRLPIECEWEFAARGGNPSDSTNWNCTYSDSDILNSVAWCNHNGHTREVGLKTANDCGIYDMIGNVWEWCWDYYSESISSDMPLTGSENGSTHSLRGECWYAGSESVTLFSKSTIASYVDNNSCVGFRLARNGAVD